MAFAFLAPLALSALSARQEADNRNRANSGAAINNAFAPLTRQGTQNFNNNSETLAILGKGAVGAVNANQQQAAQVAQNKLNETKLQILQKQLQGGGGPQSLGGGTLGSPLNVSGFSNLV